MAKRKAQTARVWFWSRAEYLRFVQAVEKLVSIAADLDVVLQREKRKRVMRGKATAASNAHDSAAAAATALDPHLTVPSPEEGGPPW